MVLFPSPFLGSNRTRHSLTRWTTGPRSCSRGYCPLDSNARSEEWRRGSIGISRGATWAGGSVHPHSTSPRVWHHPLAHRMGCGRFYDFLTPRLIWAITRTDQRVCRRIALATKSKPASDTRELVCHAERHQPAKTLPSSITFVTYLLLFRWTCTVARLKVLSQKFRVGGAACPCQS